MPHVAALVGVSASSLHSWKKSDAQFEARWERAIAAGVDRRLKIIEKASLGDWRAASWLLEHCQPEFFARNRLEVSGADGGPVQVQFYLPAKKPVPGIEAELVDAPALLEGRPDANGG